LDDFKVPERFSEPFKQEAGLPQHRPWSVSNILQQSSRPKNIPRDETPGNFNDTTKLLGVSPISFRKLISLNHCWRTTEEIEALMTFIRGVITEGTSCEFHWELQALPQALAGQPNAEYLLNYCTLPRSQLVPSRKRNMKRR
jgi:hypothetical protein